MGHKLMLFLIGSWLWAFDRYYWWFEHPYSHRYA